MSVEPVRRIIECRFGRLLYSNRQVQVHDPASNASLSAFITKGANIDPSLDTDNIDLKQKDLANKPRLEKFLDTHCHIRHSRLRSVEPRNVSFTYANRPVCKLMSSRGFRGCQTRFQMIAILGIINDTAS